MSRPIHRQMRPRSPLRVLSWQEDRLAGLVVQGLSNKEIAAYLDRSVSGVKTSLVRTCQKAGVSTRTQLAVWWLIYHCDRALTVAQLRNT